MGDSTEARSLLVGPLNVDSFSNLKRLVVFVVAAKTGAPLNRLPVYAEIASTTSDMAHGDRNRRLVIPRFDVGKDKQEALDRLLRANVSWSQAFAASNKDEEVAEKKLEAFLRKVGPLARAPVDPDVHQTVESWAESVWKNAKKLPEFRALQANIDVDHEPEVAKNAAFPLGVLATDHTGFVSFDIARLSTNPSSARLFARATRRSYSFFVYPGLREKGRVDAMSQGRRTQDAVLIKYEMSSADVYAIPHVGLGLPSMQNPSLLEWRLSPGSFATVPQSLVGTDGCESLTPASFATVQFNLRQVVRVAPEAGDTYDPAFPNGLITEYTLSLIPIGHSLGSVLYTLPLAPGESVRLAVIDWRHRELGQRDEDTKVTESLLHEQTRDRAISETVSAALDEWQRGGSIMGGLALGAGAAGTMGAYSVAGGGMASVGGAYTTSSGTRKLTADSMQKVADAVHQASNDVRELQSSVVVQVDSEEKSQLQTRVFFNNNRGHTMTVLYYEMLRHFRMVVHLNRKYRAILVSRGNWVFDEQDKLLLSKQYVLGPALLDQSLLPAFDAIRRADLIRWELERNPPPPVSTWEEANFEITNFRMFFRVGNEQSSNALEMKVVKKTNDIITLKVKNSSNINADPTPFDRDSSVNGFVIVSDIANPSIKWGDIHHFAFRKASGDNAVAVFDLSIWGEGLGGSRLVHQQTPGDYFYMEHSGEELSLSVVQPPPAPPAKPEATWQRGISIDDYSIIMRLRDHIAYNKEYYTRILDLSAHPNEYATRFETTKYGAGYLIDKVSPIPAEILGTKMAFPLLDQSDDSETADLENVPDQERLISLPTRGVFAEAKLGHCNVAEEIDDTRFWRWDEHPNPLVATEIQPPKLPDPEKKDLPLGPTNFPQSIVNIQQPLQAPDPSGLAGALSAISKPDIFRNMSGSEEVQKLLHDLIEGAVSMAQAAAQAKDIQKKQAAGASGGGGAAGKAEAPADPSIAKANVEDQRTLDQQVSPEKAQQAITMAQRQADKGNISKEKAGEITSNQLSNIRGSQKAQPVSSVPKRWRLDVTLRGYSNMVIDGQFSWEIFQRGESLGFELLAARPNGTFKIPFIHEGTDRRFKLSITGEVLHGFAINSQFSARELFFEIPADTFASSDYAYIALDAIVETFKFSTKSSDDLKRKWENEAKVDVGLGEKLNQIITIVGSLGTTWGREDTKTTEREEEFTITYYTGGMTVREVK